MQPVFVFGLHALDRFLRSTLVMSREVKGDLVQNLSLFLLATLRKTSRSLDDYKYKITKERITERFT